MFFSPCESDKEKKNPNFLSPCESGKELFLLFQIFSKWPVICHFDKRKKNWIEKMIFLFAIK